MICGRRCLVGVDLKGLEAKLVKQETDQRQLNQLPHELASVQLLECPASHPECQAVSGGGRCLKECVRTRGREVGLRVTL